MALVTLIRNNKAIINKLKEIAPGKDSFVSIGGSKNIIVPLEDHPKNAPLIGVASEYAFRFIICRNIKNKKVVFENLRSDLTFSVLAEKYKDNELVEEYNNRKQFILKYINGEDDSFEEIINIACGFAKAERLLNITEEWKKDILDTLFEHADKLLREEVKKIAELFYDSFILTGIVDTDSDVCFHPSFGSWAEKCGGAIADIYIDGILYDFKCTIDTHHETREIEQITAYYLLHCLCEMEKDNEWELKGRKINAFALYNSRFGSIKKCMVDSKKITTEQIREFGSVLNAEYEAGEKALNEMLDEIMKKAEKKRKAHRIQVEDRLEDFKFKVGDTVDTFLGKGIIESYAIINGALEGIIILDNKKDNQYDGRTKFSLMNTRSWKLIEHTELDNISIGDTVLHDKYGKGIVISIKESTGDRILIVKFDDMTRQFLESMGKIKKL